MFVHAQTKLSCSVNDTAGGMSIGSSDGKLDGWRRWSVLLVLSFENFRSLYGTLHEGPEIPAFPPFKPVVPEVTAASQRSRVPVLRNAVTCAAPSSRVDVDVLCFFLQSA